MSEIIVQTQFHSTNNNNNNANSPSMPHRIIIIYFVLFPYYKQCYAHLRFICGYLMHHQRLAARCILHMHVYKRIFYRHYLVYILWLYWAGVPRITKCIFALSARHTIACVMRIDDPRLRSIFSCFDFGIKHAVRLHIYTIYIVYERISSFSFDFALCLRASYVGEPSTHQTVYNLNSHMWNGCPCTENERRVCFFVVAYTSCG